MLLMCVGFVSRSKIPYELDFYYIEKIVLDVPHDSTLSCLIIEILACCDAFLYVATVVSFWTFAGIYPVA